MPAASPDPSSVTQSGRFLSSETLSLAAEAFRSAVFSISLVISSGMVRAGAVLAAGRAKNCAPGYRLRPPSDSLVMHWPE